jgi:predicted dehydrogenase
MKEPKRLKAGIVGYGYMGKIRKKIVEESLSLQLTGICDTDKDLMAADETIKCKRYTDYKKLLKTDIDLIFVCTPNSFSPAIVVDSLNAGKHVFCEKPPGKNLDDIKMMIEAERNNPDLKLMFGFNHRYHPGILEAKKMIEGGRLGKILFLKGTYGKSGGKNYLSSWRNQKEISGGGILLDQGIHMLDLFRYFCGDYQEIKGFLSRMFWEADVEDNAFVFLRNSDGQVATLHSSATLWKHCFKIEIFLEHAYLIVQGLLSKTGSYGRETLVVGKRQFEDESFALGNPREEVIYFDQDLSWSIEVERFSEYILKNKKVDNSSSYDALRVMELIDTLYRDEKIVDGNAMSAKGDKNI